MALVPHQKLTAFAAELLAAAGLCPAHAALSAECLVFADLRGTESHGVSRLPSYAAAVRRGLLNTAPNIAITPLAPGAARVDGDNAVGFVTAQRAMQEAVNLAKTQGIGAASVLHGNHFGVGAFFAAEAMAQDCIAMIMCNAAPAVAPWGSRVATLGTNPLTLGVPGGTFAPLLLDMATSVVAKGRIRLAAARGEAIPADWALTAQGEATTDAAAAMDGVLLPLGGPKGSGLALFIDLLSGVLSGAAFGLQTRNMYQEGDGMPNVGYFFVAIHIPAFMPMEMFRARYDMLMRDVKAGPPAAGFSEILLPGERASAAAERGRREGVAIADTTLAALAKAAQDFGIPALA
ncbi:Ldh family oxidoreductase [Roseixanthobacter glucoisosaccharinicivorans]|uniref:Ldh family oxidoreductase n=1 Tax=Roseixanthobacter glucoisosaccharinicivorans TaxID=3119923 RepID=UPI00372CD142